MSSKSTQPDREERTVSKFDMLVASVSQNQVLPARRKLAASPESDRFDPEEALADLEAAADMLRQILDRRERLEEQEVVPWEEQ